MRMQYWEFGRLKINCELCACIYYHDVMIDNYCPDCQFFLKHLRQRVSVVTSGKKFLRDFVNAINS
jgi:hypothetical protein